MERLTVAIVGFGKSATRYHLPYLLNDSAINVKYVVYVGRDPKREAAYAQDGIHFTEDINDALQDPEVQLLTLCTPPATHVSLAKQVLNAGKNVLVEKPFAPSLVQTRELLDLAKSKGLAAMPYQNRRFDSDYLTLQEVLRRGYVGTPLELISHWDKFRPDATKHEGKPQAGALYNMGIHMVDQIVGLFGQPNAVTADLRSVQNPASNYDDAYELGFSYGRFKAIVAGSPLVAQPFPRFTLLGTNGTYTKYDVDQQENDLKLGIMPGDQGFGTDQPDKYGHVRYQNSGGDWIDKDLPTITGDYTRVYHAMRDTILAGKPKLVTDEQALVDIQILENAISQPTPNVVRYD